MPYVKCCHCRPVRHIDLTRLNRRVCLVPVGYKGRIVMRTPSSLYDVTKQFMNDETREIFRTRELLFENGCPHCDGDGFVWKCEGGE